MWVCGAAGALRIDPDRNAADRFVSFHGQPVDSVARGERVWVLYPDGRLRELDARTGRTAAEVQLRNTGDAHLTPGRPGTLTLLARDKLTLIDRTNGRRLWSVRLGAPIRGWTEQGDSLWALASHAPEGRDELVRLDADTGRRTGRVFLPEPDAAALTTRRRRGLGRDRRRHDPGGPLGAARLNAHGHMRVTLAVMKLRKHQEPDTKPTVYVGDHTDKLAHPVDRPRRGRAPDARGPALRRDALQPRAGAAAAHLPARRQAQALARRDRPPDRQRLAQRGIEALLVGVVGQRADGVDHLAHEAACGGGEHHVEDLGVRQPRLPQRVDVLPA